MKTMRKCQGFTLTEAIISIAIFGLILIIVYSSYSLSQRSYLEGENLAEITQNGRVILERMAREIRQAKEIVTELPEDRTGATSAIMFQDGHDISTIHYIHYFKDDNNIKREEVAYYFSGDPNIYVPWNATPPTGQSLLEVELEPAQTIGEYVANVEFWGSGVINIYLTLEKKEKSIDFQTKIFGRNI